MIEFGYTTEIMVQVTSFPSTTTFPERSGDHSSFKHPVQEARAIYISKSVNLGAVPLGTGQTVNPNTVIVLCLGSTVQSCNKMTTETHPTFNSC